jgi:hypothetical protein
MFNDDDDDVIAEGACGATDNASHYGSEDSRFQSRQSRCFLLCLFNLLLT